MDNNNMDLALINGGDAIIERFENGGVKLLKNNDFLSDLAEIMQDDKFSKFYDKYFKTMTEIKTTVVYMKLFRAFQEKYNKLSEKELSKYVNVYLLHHVMTNSELRKKLIDATLENLEDNSKPIINIINENKLLTNKKCNKKSN